MHGIINVVRSQYMPSHFARNTHHKCKMAYPLGINICKFQVWPMADLRCCLLDRVILRSEDTNYMLYFVTVTSIICVKVCQISFTLVTTTNDSNIAPTNILYSYWKNDFKSGSNTASSHTSVSNHQQFVCSTACSSWSLHRWPVESLHKGPVMRKNVSTS